MYLSLYNNYQILSFDNIKRLSVSIFDFELMRIISKFVIKSGFGYQKIRYFGKLSYYEVAKSF